MCSGPAEHADGVRGVRPARAEAERAAARHLPAGHLSDQPVPAAGAEPLSPGQRPAVRRHVPQLAAQRLRHVRGACFTRIGEAVKVEHALTCFCFVARQWSHRKDQDSVFQNRSHLTLQGSPGG